LASSDENENCGKIIAIQGKKKLRLVSNMHKTQRAKAPLQAPPPDAHAQEAANSMKHGHI